MSYFAKPNFIVYDEWFDDDFEKTKNVLEKSEIKTISNIHEFFYHQSNYKVGASENNSKLDFDIKVNDKIITNNYFEKTTKKLNSISNRKLLLFKNLIKSKLKFNISKKLIYSLSVFSFVLIFGFLIFFISRSKKNESYISRGSFSLEKILTF